MIVAVSRGSVVVSAGPPCSGKSTLAHQLSGEAGCLVEVDAMFALLFPASDRNQDDRMAAYDAADAVACAAGITAWLRRDPEPIDVAGWVAAGNDWAV